MILAYVENVERMFLLEGNRIFAWRDDSGQWMRCLDNGRKVPVLEPLQRYATSRKRYDNLPELLRDVSSFSA